jgi:uncharacterized membrane protein (UPF0127 family)
VEIVTAGGARHSIAVEIADSEKLRRQGLMFRRELPAGHGMLLVYDAPRVANIWMKNTYVALDLLYVDEQGRVVHIVENAEPESRALMSSGVPVRAVLEIAAGESAARGIRVGDTVILPAPP